ncbi:bHLH transcription factor Myc isoform 1-T1 [Glossina fuscipes fuscipes]
MELDIIRHQLFFNIIVNITSISFRLNKLTSSLCTTISEKFNKIIADSCKDNLISEFDIMAKLCSPFSTSPRTSFLNDLLPTHSSFMDEFYITPDPFEVFGELPSIYSDIQKMESESGSSASCTALDWYDECDVKPELPNCDLMWPVPHTNSSSSISSDLAVSPSVVTGNIPTNIRDGGTNTVSVKEEPKSPSSTVSIMTVKKVNHHQESFQLASLESIKVEVKKEPIDDSDAQFKQQNIPNNKTVQQHQRSIHNAPPGTSLLRKSNNSITQQRKLLQQQPQQRQTTQQSTKRDHLLSCAPASHTTNANNYRNNSSNGSFQQPACTPQLYQRPDTPHSLDDDSSTTEFKHNIDLSACVMGSNSISLTDSQFIQQVSQELQDTSKSQIALCMDSESSLSDVLDVISTEVTNTTSNPLLGTNRQINNSMNDGGSYTNKTNNRNNISIITSSSSISHSNSFRSSECDSDDDLSTASSMSENETAYNRAMMASSAVSPVSSQNSSSSSANNVHSTQHHMDHSYTRLDDMGTNLDTPSDSEEEIDVVSINDKKLPTNPSDKDRRALQNKVAHKFNARIIKNANGLRTIPPRRRGSYEFPYTPASSSPVKSVNNSRYPSPASTPYQSQYTTKYVQQQQQLMTVIDKVSAPCGAPINIFADKSRKRLLATTGANGSLLGVQSSNNINNNTNTNAGLTTVNALNGVTISIRNSGGSNDSSSSSSSGGIGGNVMPPSKKHRGKKTKHYVANTIVTSSGVGAATILKRHCSLDESADTIEKRHLHNDMERQRRIGLKNLFEALKKQIPSIKDKERAPKVNILREAAKLCEALTSEDQQLTEQKARLREELRKRQERLTMLRAQRARRLGGGLID